MNRLLAAVVILGVVAALLLMGGIKETRPPEFSRRAKAAEMALRGEVAAPVYHHPEQWWRSNHMRLVSHRPGSEAYPFSRRECLVCHSPKTSCNMCHEFIGADPVED
ncbi:MAG: hypothetical protein V1742_06805 [Pseudomonadota bacterium]